MATQRVQVFTPKRVSESAQDTPRSEEGTGAAIQGANYLPNIYQDGQDKGGQSGQQGSGDQKLVQFLQGAGTQQLRTLAGNMRPTFSPLSPMSFIGPNAVAAAYAPMSKAEVSRRQNWGDFRPGGPTQAKYSTLNGMAISFDPADLPINAGVPREVLAKSTSVDEGMDRQVRSNMDAVRVNPRTMHRDRIAVHNLAGVRLRA
ncbi:MAG: hypothetical protein KC933_19330 [Myxococcales bacterium]|nr:hypothetical protein [Myxococcales bacterium]MCB9650595.1 hypothetical protein [Deltaproteobacteria bacterium]